MLYVHVVVVAYDARSRPRSSLLRRLLHSTLHFCITHMMQMYIQHVLGGGGVAAWCSAQGAALRRLYMQYRVYGAFGQASLV